MKRIIIFCILLSLFCSTVSSVEGALRKMVSEGELKREGSGKATCYYRLK